VKNQRLLQSCGVIAGLVLAACAGDDLPENTDEGSAFLPPTSDLEALFDGAPANDSLDEEGKTDATYPATFDLVSTQSPIRNQGGRGTCSIFATLALMEQLYNVEGTIDNPDFSEQFLQWSVKTEVGAFQGTDGSNPTQNMRAISRYGVVEESVDPYESRGWSASDDAACTGEDDQPTICYTNGTPSDDALAARRWTLPAGRYVNCGSRSVKAFMTENSAGVIATVEFFYQSWNHGGSELTVDREAGRLGWIRNPSAADIEDSRLRPAGHAVLLVGWDDTLEVPLIGADGQPLVDDAGNPVTETGFFLFKNSWGAGSFGSLNPFGAGYGWISMDYVSTHGSCYSSSIPTVRLDAETCDDGQDNNRDGRVDCDDPQCASAPACMPTGLRFEQAPALPIPDNSTDGVSAELLLNAPGTVEAVELSYSITHTYQGDLRVTLVGPSGEEIVVRAPSGGGTDNLSDTVTLTEFAGSTVAGTWSLLVADEAAQDTGTLDTWSLTFTLGGDTPDEVCDDAVDNNADGLIDCADEACLDDAACSEVESIRNELTVAEAIPDNDTGGISSIIEVTDDLTIESLNVEIAITHTYRGDLKVLLENEDGTQVVLHDRQGGAEDDLVRTYSPTEFAGTSSMGLWSVSVSDNGNLDTGTFDSWAIEFIGRR
jgi:subtilisin-like proprotein convertase family protein